MNKLKRILWLLFLLALISFLYLVFWPRLYDAPHRESNEETRFWQLRTGSVISYTCIPSVLLKHQPYPIIYLHGGPGGAISKRVMDDLRPLSQSGFDLYFYDQAGSGNSVRLNNIREYTVQRHIDDLYEIIKQVGTEKVILMGQSWGAILAAAYVGQHPETVDKIIFTSPGPIFPLNEAEINSKAPDSIILKKPLFTNKEANRTAGNIRMSAIKLTATLLGLKLASDNEVDEYANYLDSKTYKSALCDTSISLTNRGANGYYAGTMTYNSLLQMNDFRYKIRGLKIPVLVMKGECDNQPWGATIEYLKLFPNHEFIVVPGAGHFINVEQPQIYREAIMKFLLQGKF